jgi:nucleoside phosphorylase/ActR/RegA family two-component response regulator
MPPRHPRILLIDDDALHMRYYIHALSEGGFDVKFAANAKLGLKLAAEEAFEIAVLDVMMPAEELFDPVESAGGLETGLSLARLIGKIENPPQIVLLTNSPSAEPGRWAGQQSGVTFLSKTEVLPAELPGILRRVLSSAVGEPRYSGKASGQQIVNKGCDIAFLTALPKELDAVLALGGTWQERTGADSIRTIHATTTRSGVEVVAASALGMGQLNAAMLARDVLEQCNPAKIILVGIAAGVSADVSLGDVVVSDQIVDYELNNVTADGVTPRWSVYRSDSTLVSRFQNYRDRTWVRRISTARPDGRPPTDSKAHIGLVLSGNKVIADEKTAGALTSVWKRAYALEMEAAGIAAALYQYQERVAFLMIKGICDRADSHKGDDWQAYAAEAAAAFAWEFIEALHRQDARRLTPERAEPNLRLPNRALRLILSEAYNLAELKIMVSDLDIDWDEIPGSTKSERIVELLAYLKRRRRQDDLIRLLETDRSELMKSFRP